MIHTEGAAYAVEPVGGGLHALVEIDPAKVGPDDPDDLRPYPSSDTTSGERTSVRDGGPVPAPQFSASGASWSQTAPVIDVFVAYTAAAAGTTSDMAGLINGAINVTNAAHANSLVAERVRLVGTAQVTYTEQTNVLTMRNHLIGTADGQMDNVHWLRDQTYADVVVLIVADAGYDNYGNKVNGVAGDVGAVATNAFAIVQADKAISNYTFPHEIGHLMGAHHDNVNATQPYSDTHGYRYTPGLWRTIMAVVMNDGAVRIPYWSNPYVTYNGVPMGTVNKHYAANAWAYRGAFVAGFREFVPLYAVSIYGPSCVVRGSSGTWSASPFGGRAPFSYYWEYRPHCDEALNRGSSGGDGALLGPPGCSSQWYALGGAQQFTFTPPTSINSFDLRATITDGTGTQASRTDYIRLDTYAGCSGGGADRIASDDGVLDAQPADYALDAPSPNPFSERASLRFALPERARVTVALYDVLGREVARPLDGGDLPAGYHTATVEAASLPPGVYVYRLDARGARAFVRSGTVTLAR